VEFEHDAALFGLERTVVNAGRPTRIGAREKLLPALPLCVIAHDEITLEEKDLLPVIVNERRLGKRPRRQTQEAGAAAGLGDLVEIRRQDQLFEAVRVPRGALPAFGLIDREEFGVWLRRRHGAKSEQAIQHALRPRRLFEEATSLDANRS
jgi:hypothetical protein